MANSITTPTIEKRNRIEQNDKLKAKFSTLTGANLHYEESIKNEMLNKIQIKPGKINGILASIISAL